MTAPREAHVGPLRFARYAYPPNELGHCGPGQHAELLERADAGVAGPGLARLARGFDGAWPYLTLLAGTSGGRPLDADVVTAYWVGNRLLDRVDGHDLALSLDQRFGDRTSVDALVDPVRHGAVPHHSLHVLGVYPWAGLLRAGHVDPSLEVMERCLVRWGSVLEADATHAVVEVVSLAWDRGRLSLGPARAETFVHGLGGRHLVAVRPGDAVAVHWGWVCDVLDGRERRALERVTRRNLAAVEAAAHATPEPVA